MRRRTGPPPGALPIGLVVLLTAWFSGLLWATPAVAQKQTEVIGSEEERIRRPKVLEVPERGAVPIELPPEPELPPQAEGAPPILVARIEIEGATLLPKEIADYLTAPAVSERTTLPSLQSVARAITRWYRSRGYVTSRAVVPAQPVEGGVVRIRVIEGRVGEIRIEGNRYFKTELLARYLRLRPGEILQMRRLEEAMARPLNAHPDRKVRMVLAPAARPETTDIVLQVSDRRPLHASYGLDTLGPKAAGQIRQSVLLAHGNLTGADDRLWVRGIRSESGWLTGGAMSYLRPVSGSGILATLEASGVKSSLGDNLKGLLSRGNAVTVSPGVVVPLLSRSRWELEGVLGIDLKRVRTFEDERSTSKDDLRVVRGGINLIQEDARGRTLLVQEVRLGIPNLLGGSHPEDPAASRAGAGGQFFRYLATALRLQQLPWEISLVWRLSGQLASDRLAPAEQFRLGGFETVRGYPEGNYLADYGYQTTAELRMGFQRLLPELAAKDSLLSRLGRSLLLVGFWDFAEGFLRDPRASEDADARMAGVGCGLRLRPTSESFLQVDWGWAVGDADEEKDRPRIHLLARIGF